MANISRIKELASKLFLTNIEKGRIELNDYTDTELNFLEFILSKEVEIRRDKKIEIATKRSNIQTFYNLDDFKCNLTENITSWHIEKLKDTSFIDKKTNVIISSGAGTGKTMLAVGTGVNALKKGYKVFYIIIRDLLYIIDTKDTVIKSKQKMEYIKTCNLVILDEFGYIPLNTDDAIKVYNIINMINKVTSLIVITNREFTQWKNIFHDEVLASTIIDRLIDNSLILNIKCESYRLTKYKKNLE